jgi:hypothetical protein
MGLMWDFINPAIDESRVSSRLVPARQDLSRETWSGERKRTSRPAEHPWVHHTGEEIADSTTNWHLLREGAATVKIRWGRE